MGSRRALARRLGQLDDFEEPRVDLEQYATPATLAAQLIHLADLRGDLDRPVVDLGCGTGVLAIGAALRGAPRVAGIDRDSAALSTARLNERASDTPVDVDWLLADATRPPLAVATATILMNPPFGAQRTNRHADRGFLGAAAGLATVSYSVHNAGSRGFIDAFVEDHGGAVTEAFSTVLELDRRFAFHTEERERIDVEIYRIDWH